MPQIKKVICDMTLLPKRYSQIGMFLLMKLSIPIPHRLMSQLVLLFLTPLLSLFNLLFLCCFLNLGLLSPQLFLLHLSLSTPIYTTPIPIFSNTSLSLILPCVSPVPTTQHTTPIVPSSSTPYSISFHASQPSLPNIHPTVTRA